VGVGASIHNQIYYCPKKGSDKQWKLLLRKKKKPTTNSAMCTVIDGLHIKFHGNANVQVDTRKGDSAIYFHISIGSIWCVLLM